MDSSTSAPFIIWDQRFFDPIELPNGRKLVTLRDAAELISALPESGHALPHWITAIECLMLVAEHDGPTMFARIGMMRALNRTIERTFDSSRRNALGKAGN